MSAGARVTLLMLLSTFLLSANYLINDHIISPKASNVIEKIGEELHKKVAINAYAIATNDSVGRENLYKYIKKYESSLSKPYVVILFAPNSKRIGILVSDKRLKAMYDDDKVKDYLIRIVSSVDKNSLQSKYDVGLVQAYSELADEIASHKNIKLKNTIKSEGSWFLNIVTWLVYLGSVLVFWVYFGRPIYMRIRYGKQTN